MAEYNSLLPVICISGPTASGKSNFSIELATKIGGEIINADSVQVYKNFDIGSGKVNDQQLNRVKHHLISHVETSEQYSAGRFRREALGAIQDIHQRGKIPIIVGGTGMYLRALFSNFMSSYGQSQDYDCLSKIEEKMDRAEFQSWCYQLLMILDKEAASRIDVKDFFRIRRSLSLFLSSGVKSSEYRRIFAEPDSNLLGLVIILEEDSKKLYEKIDQRVIQMFDQGWVSEVEKIIEANSLAPGLKAIGYRHIAEELGTSNGLKILDIMSLIKNIQRDTRRFAKRQRTWWNNQPNTLGWTPLKKLSIFNKDFGMRANKLGQNLGSYDNCGAGEKTESSKLSPLSENLDLDTTLDPRKPRTVGRTKKNRQLELQQLKRDEERLFELSFVDGLEATSEIVKEFLSQDLSNCFQALKCENDSDGRSERVYYGKIALI